VPSFALAFLVGEDLISALGHPSGGTPAPLWAMLTASVPALVVFALPAALAVHVGGRAIHAGDDRARTPVIVAVVVAAGFIVLNAVSALTIWLG
jgi:hypothetical protein